MSQDTGSVIKVDSWGRKMKIGCLFLFPGVDHGLSNKNNVWRRNFIEKKEKLRKRNKKIEIKAKR